MNFGDSLTVLLAVLQCRADVISYCWVDCHTVRCRYFNLNIVLLSDQTFNVSNFLVHLTGFCSPFASTDFLTIFKKPESFCSGLVHTSSLTNLETTGPLSIRKLIIECSPHFYNGSGEHCLIYQSKIPFWLVFWCGDSEHHRIQFTSFSFPSSHSVMLYESVTVSCFFKNLSMFSPCHLSVDKLSLFTVDIDSPAALIRFVMRSKQHVIQCYYN